MEVYKNLSLEDLPNEEWRDVVGREGLYKVSNLGRVKRLSFIVLRGNGRIQKWNEKIVSQFTRNGYLRVPIVFGDKKIPKVVHRLVATAFIENTNNCSEVNHKDENKLNNNVENLEWCTRSYNCSYGKLPSLFSKLYKGKEKKGIKVYQYDLDGKLIKVWESLYQIRKYSNYSRSCVIEACNGLRKTAQGYQWSFNKL